MTDLPITLFFLMLIVFFAAFQSTISGFGFALLVMPLATLLLGLKIAAPLIALTGLTLNTINLFRFRHSINAGEATRLGIAAACGVPVGVWLLVNLEEHFIKFVLGFVLIAYTIYRLRSPTVSYILSQRLTIDILSLYVYATPPLLIGIVAGSRVDRYIDHNAFRVVVIGMIFVLGLSLILQGR